MEFQRVIWTIIFKTKNQQIYRDLLVFYFIFIIFRDYLRIFTFPFFLEGYVLFILFNERLNFFLASLE